MLAEFADLMEPMTLSRAAAGSDDSEGNYVAGSATTVTIQAIPVQPVKMGDMVRDEAGEFVRSAVKTYTQYAVVQDDLITYRGVQYKVNRVDDRDPIGGHYKVIMVKVQNDT
jgi:hypothetical protein